MHTNPIKRADNSRVCCCVRSSPSGPPPVPPARPPSTPPAPPLTPLECSAMDGRINTQQLPTPKFCYDLHTANPNGCESYFSLTSNNGRLRLCFNPIAPTVSSAVNCEATPDFVLCDALPPSPPPA